jgi:hypothetical protein
MVDTCPDVTPVWVPPRILSVFWEISNAAARPVSADVLFMTGTLTLMGRELGRKPIGSTSVTASDVAAAPFRLAANR